MMDLATEFELLVDRVEYIELLDEEGPLPPRDIVESLDHSRSNVNRVLRELRNADLVEKRDGDYVATHHGRLAVRQYRGFKSNAQALLSAKDLLRVIPEGHVPPVSVFTGAETIHTEEDIPIRPLEAISDRVQAADTVRAYLPTLTNPLLLRAWHRTVAGGTGDGTAIFDPDLLTVLKGQYPHLLSEMAATDEFSAVAASGPPYGLILTETDGATQVTIAVYETGAAMQGVLTNTSADAVEWAQSMLDRLETEGKAVTTDLEALSAAVADGLAQSAFAGTGATGTRPESATDDNAGHSLPLDLEAEGIVRLSREYLDTHGQADPEVSWRTGFTLPEVHAGHAVDRHDTEGRSLTDRLVDDLQNGPDHVLLGRPGAGKSTVCMGVACEWFDRGIGPVLYRERGNGDSFSSSALLEAYLRQTDDHALVVVEDAIRDEANGILEVMRALDDDHSATFLFDARTHEWRDSDPFDLDARLDAYRRSSVKQVTVPDLDERECERFVDCFVDLVDSDFDLSGEDLYEMVKAGTGGTGSDELPAGEALIVQHHLSRRYDLPADEETQAPTALDETARRTYERLADAEPQLTSDLAVLVSLLTAAGIPVADEYLYAIAPEDDFAAVDEAIALLEGRLVFKHDDPRAPPTYRTRHETWAIQFLEQVLNVESPRYGREQFSRCATKLLALADDPNRRAQIERHLSSRTPHLHQIEAEPGGWADEIVERIFSFGRTNTNLAPLFGEIDGNSIEIPDVCSEWTRLQRAYWSGRMNLTHGDYERAKREFETLGELAETTNIPDNLEPITPVIAGSYQVDVEEEKSKLRTLWKIESRANLGWVIFKQDAYDEAQDHLEWALITAKEIGVPEATAACRRFLGAVARRQCAFDQARNHLEQALDTAQELDSKGLESACLTTLGIVADQQGDYSDAREYHEKSLAIARDLNNRSSEAVSLVNLGSTAYHQTEFEAARRFLKESLALFRSLGHRHGEASCLTNLGNVAIDQGAYEAAREYYEQSLNINRDLGDLHGEANSFHTLGDIAREEGAVEESREYYEKSLTLARDLDNTQMKADNIGNLGAVARMSGDHSSARGRLDEALEAYEAIEDKRGIAWIHLERARLSLAENSIDDARKNAREAINRYQELGKPQQVGSGQLLLGRIAATNDAPDNAREYWQSALETFERVSVLHDALETLKELVEICRMQNDVEEASEWLERAQNLLADAPEATAHQHRDWVKHQAAELDT